MSFKAKAVEGIKWQAIEIVSRNLFSLILFSALTRLLAPTDFGLAALVSTFIVLGNLFVDQGIGTALLQRKELEPDHVNVAFWINLSTAVVVTVLTWLLAGFVADFYREPQLALLLRVGILAILINSSSMVQSFIFIREMDFRNPMLRNLLGNVIGGCSGILIAVAGFGVWSLIGQQLIGAITSCIFVWTASKWRPSFRFSMRHCRELLHVSSVASMGVIITILISRVDQLIIGKFLGSSILGEYSVASKLTEMISSGMQTPIKAVAESGLARMQSDHFRICQAVYKGMEFNALVAFPVFVGLAAVSNELVLTLFAGKWDASGPMCALLSLNMLISGLKIFFWPALLASGDIRRSVYIHGVTLAFISFVCLVGVQHGIAVVVAGMILVNLLMSIPCLILLRSRIGLDPFRYCGFCVMPAVASVIMGVAVMSVGWSLMSSVPVSVRLIIKILTGAATYSSMMMILSPQSLKGMYELVGHGLGKNSTGIDIQSAKSDGETEIPSEQ
jgi:O-antigen/teichoic acid export membrane protein